MVIGADVVRLPDESVETAVSVCLPSGSEPLIHSTVPEQLAPAQTGRMQIYVMEASEVSLDD